MSTFQEPTKATIVCWSLDVAFLYFMKDIPKEYDVILFGNTTLFPVISLSLVVLGFLFMDVYICGQKKNYFYDLLQKINPKRK